jgi:hypothetical protein
MESRTNDCVRVIPEEWLPESRLLSAGWYACRWERAQRFAVEIVYFVDAKDHARMGTEIDATFPTLAEAETHAQKLAARNRVPVSKWEA